MKPCIHLTRCLTKAVSVGGVSSLVTSSSR
jgi:hypothetical protein